METTTITEGLAEIKTLTARIQKRRETVLRYLARDIRLRDPLEKEGGSVDFIKRERQAIADLEDRLVRIRCAIQTINGTTTLTLGETVRSIAYWLNWRREIAEKRAAFLGMVTGAVGQARKYAGGITGAVNARGERVPSAEAPIEIVVNVDEALLAKEVELHEKIIGDLDGRLSLLNATTTITF